MAPQVFPRQYNYIDGAPPSSATRTNTSSVPIYVPIVAAIAGLLLLSGIAFCVSSAYRSSKRQKARDLGNSRMRELQLPKSLNDSDSSMDLAALPPDYTYSRDFAVQHVQHHVPHTSHDAHHDSGNAAALVADSSGTRNGGCSCSRCFSGGAGGC